MYLDSTPFCIEGEEAKHYIATLRYMRTSLILRQSISNEDDDTVCKHLSVQEWVGIG